MGISIQGLYPTPEEEIKLLKGRLADQREGYLRLIETLYQERAQARADCEKLKQELTELKQHYTDQALDDWFNREFVD